MIPEAARAFRNECAANEFSPTRGHASATRLLVLGLGNSLLGDDGIGIRVVEYLRRENAFPNVEFVDGGTLSFSLLGLLESAAGLLVIDAAELGDIPGSVRVFQDGAMDRFLSSSRRRSVHEVGLCDLLDMARLLGCVPQRRALLCVQPATVAWGDTLSAAVASTFDNAAAHARRVLREWIRT